MRDPRIPWSLCDVCGRTVFEDEFDACRWRYLRDAPPRPDHAVDERLVQLYGGGRLDLVCPRCQRQ